MLERLEIGGFKSFAKKTTLDFGSRITAIVGPNGSGKSNVAEAFRFALGEQSMKSMRGKRSEDLIWNGSASAPRAGRAAVSIVFNNARKQFKVDFDEVSIERAIFRDGTAEYSVNGSRVRLRDIEELLAGAGIGETGHHIISQGEADRILLASSAERRQMLEDALGLAIYEFKKTEAERKLLKTEENIAQVNALRRELAPHLRFLEKQVEKLNRAEEVRGELARAYQTYLAIEDLYLAVEREKAAEAIQAAHERIERAGGKLARMQEETSEREDAKHAAHLRSLEAKAEHLSGERAALSRKIGQVEGALEAAKRRSALAAREPYAKVPREDLVALRAEIERRHDDTPEAIAAALRAIRTAIRAFVDRFAAPVDDRLEDEEHEALTLEREAAELLAREAKLGQEHERTRSALMAARQALFAREETGKELRRDLLAVAQEKAKYEAEVARLEEHARELTHIEGELESEKAQALALGGSAAVSYKPLEKLPHEERRAQEERKRTIERLKIRLEEAGGGGEDVRHEFKEVSERESFLARELDDLARSAAALRELAEQLDTELGKHFADGLAKVNAAFGEFFGLMFGGGSAKLALEEPEESEEAEEEDAPRKAAKPGIDISVHLPRKRIQSLMQLSGGERALTSIALIFAMSQVNPPPFLILDETDAALDEANSRRYGDMLENLSKRSQLIVITHNRETMSRAGILYGVTMGGDGISKLLSVKFDEAVAVAK